MMQSVDFIIENAAQVITCAAPDGPKRGLALADVGVIENGAVAVADGRIVAVGPASEITAAYDAGEYIDATGRVICPGFVDCHTHVVYAGDRVDEFERRIQGASYMEIMVAGGGINSTVRATRAASVQALVDATRPRLDAMLALGTTTVEVKTGYGLDTATELKMLEAIATLDAGHPLDLVPTFLGAHAVPPEYAGQTNAYVNLVINEMLPAARDWYRSSRFAGRGTPLFVDVFCEAGVFDHRQSARVLAAGEALGMRAKLHADEFESLGGVTLAVEMDAVSVDHLDVTGPDEIARLAASETVAVLLPAVNFNLGSTTFADARAMIDVGAAVALSTDANPGSAPCLSLPFIMALACRYQRLLPAEALNACTINAAHALGLGDRIGSIEPGKQADLLMIAASDYRHLAYTFGHNLVEMVMKGGAVADPSSPAPFS